MKSRLIALCRRWAAPFLLLPMTSRAHGDEAPSVDAWWRAWDFEPAIVVTLLIAAILYAVGLHRVRRATAMPGKLRRAGWCYAAGWSALAVALISPVHPLGRALFSVHMVQHELLMVVAAPLLVLGRPLLVTGWALGPQRARRGVVLLRDTGLARGWAVVENPFVASLLHALALWLWHVPAWFEATRDHALVHALQHASFFGTAVLFWQAVFYGPRRRAGHGLAVLYLFVTAVHSGALGALITFASRMWYPAYAESAPAWGLSGLEDQQLGGIIMWVPAGLIYVAAALVLLARWINDPAPRAQPSPPVARLTPPARSSPAPTALRRL
jgi:putative membrane protein